MVIALLKKKVDELLETDDENLVKLEGFTINDTNEN